MGGLPDAGDPRRRRRRGCQRRRRGVRTFETVGGKSVEIYPPRRTTARSTWRNWSRRTTPDVWGPSSAAARTTIDFSAGTLDRGEDGAQLVMDMVIVLRGQDYDVGIHGFLFRRRHLGAGLGPVGLMDDGTTVPADVDVAELVAERIDEAIQERARTTHGLRVAWNPRPMRSPRSRSLPSPPPSASRSTAGNGLQLRRRLDRHHRRRRPPRPSPSTTPPSRRSSPTDADLLPAFSLIFDGPPPARRPTVTTTRTPTPVPTRPSTRRARASARWPPMRWAGPTTSETGRPLLGGRGRPGHQVSAPGPRRRRGRPGAHRGHQRLRDHRDRHGRPAATPSTSRPNRSELGDGYRTTLAVTIDFDIAVVRSSPRRSPSDATGRRRRRGRVRHRRRHGPRPRRRRRRRSSPPTRGAPHQAG